MVARRKNLGPNHVVIVKSTEWAPDPQSGAREECPKINGMPPTLECMHPVKQIPAKKISTAILPPSDPARPDWGILSDSLGLKEHARPAEGATSAQASAQMRELLFRCVEAPETYEALIFKCAGSTIAGRTRDDSAAKANFPEMMAFVRTRLWNRRSDGTKTVSKLGREHSSNDIIAAWNPEAGGVKKYIQVNVANILNRDWKAVHMDLANPKKASVEQLAEQGKHLDSTGRIYVAGQTGQDDGADAPEFVEKDDDFERDAALMSVSRKRGGDDGDLSDSFEGGTVETPLEELEDNELAGAEGEQPAAKTEQRGEFDVALAASKGAGPKSSVLRSPEHPDYRVLAAALVDDVPEPELDLAGRENQLRGMARSAIDLHCSDLTDFDETRDAVAEWNPSEVSFARFFPEAVQQIGESLNVADRQLVRDDPLQLEFAADFFILAGEITRQSQQLRPRPTGMSAIEWEEITHNAKEWFVMQSKSQEDLENPARPDYMALCHLTDRKIERDIEPKAMAEKLKSMYAEWTVDRLYSPDKMDAYAEGAQKTLSENWQSLRELNRRMETWDPLTDGYAGEVMATHLRDIRMEQEQLEQEALSEEASLRAALEARLARVPGPEAVRPASIPSESLAAEPSLFPELEFGPKAEEAPQFRPELPSPGPEKVKEQTL